MTAGAALGRLRLTSAYMPTRRRATSATTTTTARAQPRRRPLSAAAEQRRGQRRRVSRRARAAGRRTLELGLIGFARDQGLSGPGLSPTMGRASRRPRARLSGLRVARRPRRRAAGSGAPVRLRPARSTCIDPAGERLRAGGSPTTPARRWRAIVNASGPRGRLRLAAMGRRAPRPTPRERARRRSDWACRPAG